MRTREEIENEFWVHRWQGDRIEVPTQLEVLLDIRDLLLPDKITGDLSPQTEVSSVEETQS
jgi:hypothetical protein